MATLLQSAGLAVVRRDEQDGCARVLLGRLGGPFWARKERAWSIPKGLIDDDEDPATAARRELAEETGYVWPEAEPLIALGQFQTTRNKLVTAFLGLERPGAHPWSEVDFVSNTFELQWPPRSGQIQTFPEMERATFLGLAEAREVIQAGQLPILDALATALASAS